jgi:hypothetical protein
VKQTQQRPGNLFFPIKLLRAVLFSIPLSAANQLVPALSSRVGTAAAATYTVSAHPQTRLCVACCSASHVTSGSVLSCNWHLKKPALPPPLITCCCLGLSATAAAASTQLLPRPPHRLAGAPAPWMRTHWQSCTAFCGSHSSALQLALSVVDQ